MLDFIDRSFPERATDENQQANWHLARAIMTGYASRYATEDFTIIEIEKSFTGKIRNPDTGRCSQTFVMAGKADAIVQRSDGMYLLEHKTAAIDRFELSRQAVDRYADRVVLLLPA